LIHARDLAGGLVLAAEHPGAAGRTYHLANEEPETLEGLSALVAGVLQRRTITLRLPPAAFALAGELSELAGKVQGRPQILDRNKALEASQLSWASDPRRAREELGFRAAVEVREGVRETADWYRRVGWL
jgi:nucleoside-diphosphate-sugar epimerase